METGFRTYNRSNRGARGRAWIVLAVLLLCLTLFVACGSRPTAVVRKAEISDDFKTEYFVGEAFSPSGELRIPLDGGGYEAVAITEDMVTGFDTSTAGEILVTIHLGEYTATSSIRVKEIKADSITLDADTLPAALYYKQPFPSTVTITAQMSNGTTLEHVPVTGRMVGGFDSTRLGAQTVTVSYLGVTTVFSVTVKEDVRLSIAPVGLRTEYDVGDSLDLEDAYLVVTYESGKTPFATLTANLISGFRTDLGGDFTAKITYEGLECDYDYFVKKSPASLSLTEGKLPTVLEKGDAFPTGGEATLVYDDDTRETISLTVEHAPSFDVATPGQKKVPITVQGVVAYYEYTVLPAILSATPFGYTSAVMKDAAFDRLGEFLLEFEDDTREVIPFTDTERLTIDYDTSEVGDVEQTITYRQRRYTFLVHVYDESEREDVDHLEVEGVLRTIKQGDAIDPTGVRVYVVYKYLAPQKVSLQADWVEADLPDEIAGDYVDVPVTVRFGGATYESESFFLRVLSVQYASTPTSLTPQGFRTRPYRIGETLDLAALSMTVVYGGGYERVTDVPVLSEYLSGFDSSAKGEKTMTLTFGGLEVPIPYRVIDDAEAEAVTDLSVASFDPLLFVGDDLSKVDVTGLTVSLTIGYGYAVEQEALTLEMLSGGPFAEAGEAEILLTCRGTTKRLPVTVHPASDKTRLTSIRVPETLVAYIGSTPDLSLYYLELTYGYGLSSESVSLDSDGVTISDYATGSIGTVTVTVSYLGETCTASVTFIAGDGENVLESVDVAADAVHSFAVGDELDGVSLVARYQNGKYERIAVTEEMAPAFSTEAKGSFTITITYGGRGVLYAFDVHD